MAAAGALAAGFLLKSIFDGGKGKKAAARSKELEAQVMEITEEKHMLTEVLMQKMQSTEELSDQLKAVEQKTKEMREKSKPAILEKQLAALEYQKIKLQDEIQKLGEEKRKVEREFGNKATIATRTSTMREDSNDGGAIPFSQWQGERRFLQSQVDSLKEKLAQAEKSLKAEAQLKEKLRNRMEVVEASIKNQQGSKLQSFHNGEDADGVTTMPVVLYDTLQGEVLKMRAELAENLKELAKAQEEAASAKKACETALHAKEAEAKKFKADYAALQKENTSLRVELVTAEESAKEQVDAVKRENLKLKNQINQYKSLNGELKKTNAQLAEDAIGL
eukprot:jgi/Mesvir1/1185/Mv25698-RA.1